MRGLKSRWLNNKSLSQFFCLRNKLSITNEHDLSIAEREISSLRIMEIENEPLKGKLDFKHLKGIHFL